MQEYNFEPDYAKWWKEKDLSKEQIIWLMLGVNPDDIKRSKDIEASGEPQTDDDRIWNSNFSEYLDSLPAGFWAGRTHQQWCKLLSWQNDKIKIVSEAYEGRIEFADSFKDFLLANDNWPENEALEQYRDHKRYELDWDKVKINKIQKAEDAFAILLGFRPEDFTRFLALENRQKTEPKIDNDFAPYVTFKSEDKWFYSEYHSFITASYDGMEHYSFATHAWREANFWVEWDGNFEKYAQALYNRGFIFKPEVIEKLQELGITLQYDENGWAYEFYRYWLKKGGWTATEAVYLFKGQYPDKDGDSFIDLSQNRYTLSPSINDSILSWDNHSKSFEHLEKSLERYRVMEKIKSYPMEKNILFEPKEIVEWLLQQTLHTPPVPLFALLNDAKAIKSSQTCPIIAGEGLHIDIGPYAINPKTESTKEPQDKQIQSQPSIEDMRQAAMHELKRKLSSAGINLQEIPFKQIEVATILQREISFQCMEPESIVSHYIKKDKTIGFKKGAPSKKQASLEDYLAQNGT